MKVECAHDKLVPVGDLKPHPKNPNTHSAAQIAALAHVIESSGWRAPITVSSRSGFIVRGHGRLEAAFLLGCETVPVDYQDYPSDEAELADLLADNHLSELCEIDEQQLVTVLRELDQAGFDLASAGFTPEEFARLTEQDDPADALKPIPAMELQAFEHYDYLIFMFRDIRDWLRILQLLAVTRVNFSISRQTQKIGVGRVLDGKRLLGRLEDPPRDPLPGPQRPPDHPPADPPSHARRPRRRT